MSKQKTLLLHQTLTQVKEFAKTKSEHDLRLKVRDAFFGDYDVNVEDERIDFLVYHDQSNFFTETLLWAESKDKPADIVEMFAQLLLTIKKKVDSGEIPPKYLGVFDREKIAFTEYTNALIIFNLNDFNWNERPSSVSKKTVNQVAKYLKNIVEFRFDVNAAEIVEFIKTNFVLGYTGTAKAQINKNNFVTIYNKWVREVLPSINLSDKDWKELKKNGIGNCEFYLADLLSENNKTISDKLNIILQSSYYESKVQFADKMKFYYEKIAFRDKGEAHSKFWIRYERPPKQEYHKHIIERRDLLVPQNIREHMGAYFTPQIWVEKSQEYLADVFGENWQEEYYIWDCCAGTCNLLAGLTNKYNVWASTIDQPDVDIVHELITKNEFNLLATHVFQFDFLNDDFSKLPKGLHDIIKDEEKRKKLIIYMNPPYGEGDRRVGQGRSGIALSGIQKKYGEQLGYTKRERFTQFLARIYFEISGCKIGEFSKMKVISNSKFGAFRDFFKASLSKCFIIPANSFDNVTGHFPIGFKIWDTERLVKGKLKRVGYITADVFNHTGIRNGKKKFWLYENEKLINDWAETFNKYTSESLGNIIGVANDFQHQKTVCIQEPHKPWNHKYQWQITQENLIRSAIYFAVRHCEKATWLNDRDQFLFPNEGYKTDRRFQTNCLVFTLFHHQNRRCSMGEKNPWIPFTAREVDAKDNFRTTFMSDFLQKHKPMSKQALAVLQAGKKLWQYYHETIKYDEKAFVDASLYEIREYFKGRDDKGRMKSKATDKFFNELDTALRSALQILANEILPKVYKYGFLRK